MKLRSGWNEGRTWPLTGARLKLLYFVSHICGNNQTLSTWKECIYGRKNHCLFPLDWSLSASTSRLKKNFAPINPMPKVCTLFRQWANNFWAACEWGCDCISICVWSITWKSRNYYSACCSTAQTNQTYLEEAAWSTLKSSNQIITTSRLFIPVQLRNTFTKPFWAIIYEHRSLLRPTYAWIQPAANWKTLEVREKKQGVSSKQWPSKQLETSGNKFLEFGSKAWMVSKEDAACTSAGPCQTQKQLCTAHQYRTHKCNSRACKDMTKALELFMDVADTKPKHKALGTNGKQGKLEKCNFKMYWHLYRQREHS